MYCAGSRIPLHLLVSLCFREHANEQDGTVHRGHRYLAGAVQAWQLPDTMRVVVAPKHPVNLFSLTWQDIIPPLFP